MQSGGLDAQPSIVQIVGDGCGVIQEGSGIRRGAGLCGHQCTRRRRHPPALRRRHERPSPRHRHVVRPRARHLGPQGSRADRPDHPCRHQRRRPGNVRRRARLSPKAVPFVTARPPVDAAFEATGLDIYGQRQIAREVYELNALVQPGNSGGPIVASGDSGQGIPDGTVIGVVFARSTTNTNVGYALAMHAVGVDIQKGEASTTPSGTGQCASS